MMYSDNSKKWEVLSAYLICMVDDKLIALEAGMIFEKINESWQRLG